MQHPESLQCISSVYPYPTNVLSTNTKPSLSSETISPRYYLQSSLPLFFHILPKLYLPLPLFLPPIPWFTSNKIVISQREKKTCITYTISPPQRQRLDPIYPWSQVSPLFSSSLLSSSLLFSLLFSSFLFSFLHFSFPLFSPLHYRLSILLQLSKACRPNKIVPSECNDHHPTQHHTTIYQRRREDVDH